MRQNRTFDVGLLMKDAGAVTSSAAAQVSAADKILDLGTGRMVGELVIDVTAMEVDSGNESYTICWQLSTKSDFADTIVSPIQIPLGDAAATAVLGDSDVPGTTPGRLVIPVTNEVNDVCYRYARLYHLIAGTIVTGINYKAFLTKLAGNTP